MNRPYLFRVFVDEQGNFGNPGSLIVDDLNELDEEHRISITSEIGHDETAFIDDLTTNKLSIYHSYGRVGFAGSVLVGVAWQLFQLKNIPALNIKCDIGEIPIWQEGEINWLRASLENNLGNWEYEMLESPDAVNAIEVSETEGWKKMVWAWEDERKGLIRARTFASKINIPEVQGNGSGSMNLAGQLQKSLVIKHGDGSVIYARPADNYSAELGGRVIGSTKLR
jgi:predicted PhzF superfamily epimerase YddE/YHI9